MRRAERVVNINVAQFSQGFPELLHLFGVSLYFLALGVDSLAFLFEVETEVLEKDDGAGFRVGAGGLDVRADAVGQESYFSENAVVSY